MKLNLRLKEGWKTTTNQQKYKCDIDGSKLFVAPDGETIYCDQVHEEKTAYVIKK